MIVAVAVVIIFVGLGVGMSNVTPDTPRPSMEQQAMAPKIIESSSKEKISKESSMELKVKSDDKKLPTKLHKISKDLKDKKIKLKSKLSPEVKERVKATMDSWEIKKIIPLESPRPITEEYFKKCISEPPPSLKDDGTDWDHCNISYLEFYGTSGYESDPHSDISMINSDAKQIVFYNYYLKDVNGVSSDLTLSEFTNVKIEDANFNHAEIGGIHFINSNLDGVNFSDTDCNEIIPGTSDYYPCIFENVESRNTISDNVNWKNVHILNSYFYDSWTEAESLSDVTISNSHARLGAVNNNNIHFANSMGELSWKGSETRMGSAQNVNIENSWLYMGSIDTNISEMEINNSVIEASVELEYWDDVTWNNITINNSATDLSVGEVEINNMMISNVGFPIALSFSFDEDREDPYVSSGRLSFSTVIMNNVTIEDSHITRFHINNSEMNNVTIEDSHIEYLRVISGEMNNVQIINSILYGPVFSYVDLSTTDLSGTEIIGGTFTGVTTGDTPLGCTGHPICD
jgi:uncharacterized protein YjbI with pentapeptide repeats